MSADPTLLALEGAAASDVRAAAQAWDGKTYGRGSKWSAHPCVRRTPCTACGAAPGVLCRTVAGLTFDVHKARRETHELSRMKERLKRGAIR